MTKKEKEIKAETKRKNSFWKWIFRLFMLFFVLFLLLLLAFKLPVVQRWTLKKINSQLSEKFEHHTQVNEIDIDILEGVVLNDFLVNKKNNTDTLLYVNEFSFSLRESLLSLIGKRLLIDEVNLKNVLIDDFHKKGEDLSDFKRLLSIISGTSMDNQEVKEVEKAGKKKKPVFLSVKHINFQNLSYRFINQDKEQDVNAHLLSGHVKINTLDVIGNFYGVDELVLNEPIVDWLLRKREESVLPTTKVDRTTEVEEESGELVDVRSLFEDKNFYTSADKIRITDGTFKIKDENRAQLDFLYEEINLSIDSFYFNSEPVLHFVLNDFNLKEKNHINIHQFSIGKFDMKDRKLVLDKLVFRTDKSHIENSIKLKYGSLNELFSFSERLFGSIEVEPCKLSVEEVLFFLPKMKNKPIFAKNRNAIIYFDGDIKGRKNRINIRNLNLRLGKKLRFKGDIAIKNLFNDNENLYNITIDQLLTSVQKLQSIIPNFTVPNNYLLLGNLDYKGRLDGYLKDFVSYGELNTNLGKAKLDMRLDMNNRIENAQYSGSIEVIDFDLRSWSGNKDLDHVSLIAKVKEGRGLVKDNAHAVLEANIRKIGFRGYMYQNVKFNGELNKKKFFGKLNIDDENVVFDFDGNFELLNDHKLMDFKLVVEKMNLKNLHLSKEDMAMSGRIDVDFSGNSIEDVLGSLRSTNLTLRKGNDVFLFDTASVNIRALTKDRKAIDFYSDIADFNIQGHYNIKDLPKIFQSIIQENYPRYYDLFNIPITDITIDKNQKFSYKYNIKDTKQYLNLLGQKGMRIIGASGNGNVNMMSESMDFHLNLPSFDFKENKLKSITVSAKLVGDVALLNVGIDSINLKNRVLDPIHVNVRINRDTLNWNFLGGNFIDSIGTVDIGGKMIPKGKGVNFNFYENKLELLGTKWHFEDNLGYFAKEHIEIDKLVLTDGNRIVRISDINNKGLKANISGIEVGAFNEMINYDKMDFFGLAEMTIKFDNLFDKGNAFIYLDVENLHVNEDDYGNLSSTISIPYQMPITGNLLVLKDSLNLSSDIFYDRQNDSLDIATHGLNLRMDIFEFLIRSGLSDVEGTVNADAHVYGGIKNLKIDGSGMVNYFKGKVDYLGTYYTAKNQKFSSDTKFLDLNGIQIQDMDGNTAYVKGGIHHDFFIHMNFDLDISSDNLIVLNTTKEDNPYYYGYGIGQLSTSIDGLLDYTDMKVDLVTKRGSQLFFPVHTVQSDLSESFIQFVDLEDGKEVYDSLSDYLDVTGLDLELRLKLNRDANVSIIFDERLGDVIKGVGTGDLQIYNRRNGDFNIFGDYTIENGEYRFTAFNGWITKPFVVNPGSNLKWSGDPLNADINIYAHYDGLRVAMDDYLQEYISNFDNDELLSEAKNKTEVDLTVNLIGSLFKPDISFDVDFPNLTGVLKSFASSKTSSLKQNETIFNQQVASLIVTQRFLPISSSGGAIIGQIIDYDTGLNTLSEFVTGQFSDILTGFLEEAVSNSIWADIDVDLGVAKRSLSAIEGGPDINQGFLPNEIEIRVKNKFKAFDERLSFNFGGNYYKDNVVNNSNLLIGDFQLEYYFNAKRNLKARMYLKSDYEGVSETLNRRTKLGVGIAYEYEFGDMIITTKKKLLGKKGKKVGF